MLYMKKFLSLLLVLGLLGSSQAALAAEESPAPLPGWSHSILADGYSLGLFGDEIGVQHSQTVTMEQVEALARTVGDKLALLDLEPRPTDGTALVLDTTRGGVVNALYQEAAAYAFPDVEQGPEAFMTSVGALAGDGSGLHLDRPCTVLEAAAMANSLILNLYDWQDAGSLGLLWRADNGRGNVLYLLGSIHTDRNNLYPFHKQLRDVILNAEQVSFELDFNDTDQLLEFAAMQTYPAGDSLANHISPALYQAVVQATAQLGMDEGTVSQYKPWALANSFSSLATLDETSSENAMAIDLYVNAKAINAGIDIGAVETYAFQGQIFDTLSPEYQEQYLASGLLLILDPDSISQETRDALTQVLGERDPGGHPGPAGPDQRHDGQLEGPGRGGVRRGLWQRCHPGQRGRAEPEALYRPGPRHDPIRRRLPEPARLPHRPAGGGRGPHGGGHRRGPGPAGPGLYRGAGPRPLSAPFPISPLSASGPGRGRSLFEPWARILTVPQSGGLFSCLSLRCGGPPSLV